MPTFPPSAYRDSELLGVVGDVCRRARPATPVETRQRAFAVAEGSAREMGRISLMEALELTALIAMKDSRRHGRAGARWMRRYLDEKRAQAWTTSRSSLAVFQRWVGRSMKWPSTRYVLLQAEWQAPHRTLICVRGHEEE